MEVKHEIKKWFTMKEKGQRQAMKRYYLKRPTKITPLLRQVIQKAMLRIRDILKDESGSGDPCL
jgi:hypothetical protein